MSGRPGRPTVVQAGEALLRPRRQRRQTASDPSCARRPSSSTAARVAAPVTRLDGRRAGSGPASCPETAPRQSPASAPSGPGPTGTASASCSAVTSPSAMVLILSAALRSITTSSATAASKSPGWVNTDPGQQDLGGVVVGAAGDRCAGSSGDPGCPHLRFETLLEKSGRTLSELPACSSSPQPTKESRPDLREVWAAGPPPLPASFRAVPYRTVAVRRYGASVLGLGSDRTPALGHLSVATKSLRTSRPRLPP